MKLFKELTANLREIGKIVVDTDIFGIEKLIKVVYKNGDIDTYNGSDIKDIKFFIEIGDDEDKKNMSKRLSYHSDAISYIEVYERDKEFYPTRYKVVLEDGRGFVFNTYTASIDKAMDNDADSFNMYMLDTLESRYNTTDRNMLKKCLKIEPIKTDLNDRDNPVNRFIRSHRSVKNNRIKEDGRIISFEQYKKIDIISCDDEYIPTSIVVFYDSDRYVRVSEDYVCNKYLKSALSRGIDTCTYYPSSNDAKVADLRVFTHKFDDKMSLKKQKLNKLFAIFSNDKILKK